MLVNLPHWLGSLRSVTAAQVKAMYDAIAAVVNGNLGRDNFAPRAAFRLANKAAPKAYVPLQGQLVYPFAGDGGYGDATALETGPSVLRWKIPAKCPADRKQTARVVAWSSWLGGTDGTSVQSGVVRLRHIPVATGVAVQKDEVAIPAGTEIASLGARALAAFDAAPGDVLEVQVAGPCTFNGGGTRIRGFGASVWLEMNHVP